MEHLLSVGYTKVDVVEMPGQVTIRGGIIDVYSPEQDRPVRIDFFGDEIESIRKFDPETQRSSSTLDEALLLPLTETPVTERLLTAINARLTRSGLGGRGSWRAARRRASCRRMWRRARATRRCFRGGSFSRRWRARTLTLLELMGRDDAGVCGRAGDGEEPGRALVEQGGAEARARGHRILVRPEDMYISPWELEDRMRGFPGCELDQLGAVDVLDATGAS